MDKNVGSVDIDELRKAREELNQERGIETDPNMYDNYNPNRGEESSTAVVEETDGGSFENSSNLEEQMISVAEMDEPVLPPEDFSEQSAEIQTESEEPASTTSSVGDSIFSDEDIEMINSISNSDSAVQEVSEENSTTNNVEEKPSENAINFDDFDLSLPETSDEKTTDSVGEVAEKTEKQSEIVDETAGEVNFDVYDNFADFEVAENNNIIAAEPVIEEKSKVEIPVIETAASENAENSFDLSFEIETEAEKPAEQSVEGAEQNETAASENIEAVNSEVNYLDFDVKLPSDEISESAESFSVLEDEVQTTETSENETIETSNDETDDDIDAFALELENAAPVQSIEPQEAETTELTDEEQSEQEAEPQVEETDSEKNYAETDAVDDYTVINSLIDGLEGLKPTEPEQKEPEEDLSIIDNYRKLEQLDRLLAEDEESPEPVVVEVPKIEYPEIEAVNFVDIISNEEFKKVDNLSYILGVDELGTVHYGNLRDFYNMVIFAKDNVTSASAINSILVSLILKNPTSDINFVICDSKADSKLQAYNKSSYMYFNRLAKTNKEILDTLIEISKELEERYKILAAAGVKSIEQYNIIAKNDGLKQLPYILTVFNNYSKAMQWADSDKINTLLYQILKFGRIVGLYLILSSNTPVKFDDINYNLPTRLSFKMTDEDSSLSMLGDSSAECLVTDDEFLLSSLDSSKLIHLKVPSLSDKELEVLIKNIEE